MPACLVGCQFYETAECAVARARVKMGAVVSRAWLIAGIALAAASPALAASPTFGELLSRAEAQAAAGHRWSPAGDNMTETVAGMMDIISEATPQELAALSALLEKDAALPPSQSPVSDSNQAGSNRGAAVQAMPGQADPAQVAPAPPTPAQPTPAPPTRAASIKPLPPEPPETRLAPNLAPATSPAPAPSASVPPASVPPASVPPAPVPPAPAASVSASGATAPAVVPPSQTPPSSTSLGQARAGISAQPLPPPVETQASLTPNQRPAADSSGPDQTAPRAARVLPSRPTTRALELFARGQEAERQGNVSGARRLFGAAVEQGSAAAARSLGRLYDPAYLKQTALGGIDPDAALARRWYERAVTMGDAEAGSLLEALAVR